MKPRLLALVTSVVCVSAAGAPAAMIVHDPTNFAKLVEHAQTALAQLDELKAQVAQARKVVAALEEGADLGATTRALTTADMANALIGVADLGGLSGEAEALGDLHERAADIRRRARVHRPDPENPHSAALEQAGARIARDLAIAEAVSRALEDRDKALEDLLKAGASAQSARAVLDVQAQAQVASARLANDQLRLTALQWGAQIQAAQEQQQQAEAAALARAERLALFRATFAP